MNNFKKPKFKPVITRVKLNPEQAVLTCNCYSGVVPLFYSGVGWSRSTSYTFNYYQQGCIQHSKTRIYLTSDGSSSHCYGWHGNVTGSS